MGCVPGAGALPDVCALALGHCGGLGCAVWRECLAAGRFGKFGKSSVFRQTLTSQIFAYKWYPYG